MKEIVGELWDYYGKPNTVICITTNGTLKKNGFGVMGRGCAAEAKLRIPEIEAYLGEAIRVFGNIPTRLSDWGIDKPIVLFPVKYDWWEPADLGLIRRSAEWLATEAALEKSKTFILPRPGCGNGKLKWKDVKVVIEPILKPDNIWVISREK